jgi:hypothetical protein
MAKKVLDSQDTLLLCSHLTKIHSDSPEPADCDGVLEEISRTRAVVSVECPLIKGTSLRIDCETCELRGKVTGCDKLPDGYMAQIAFPDDQTWKPANFKPDGLFNPNYLVCVNPNCTPDCVGASCRSSPSKRRRARKPK